MINPFNELDVGAVGAHELFMSYVRAGFTRAEALEIVKTIMIEFVRINREHLQDGSSENRGSEESG